MAEQWASDDSGLTRFGYLVDGAYETVAPEVFEHVLRQVFLADRAFESDEIISELGETSATIPIDCVWALFDAVLLSEPAYRMDVLSTFLELSRSGRVHTFALAYDALPALSPWIFPRSLLRREIDIYFQWISNHESVAFISDEIKQQFESRLRRRPYLNATVCPLGSDGLGYRGYSTAGHGRQIVALGTVEPKKRYPLILETYDALRRDGTDVELKIFGRAGVESPEFLESLRRRADADVGFSWSENPTDQMITQALESALFSMFIGTEEGYGLPALESLALGAPVIVSADLPCLKNLPSHGQMRLAEVTGPVVLEAARQAADEEFNDGLRMAIQHLPLPSWQGFAGSLRDWIESSCAVPLN